MKRHTKIFLNSRGLTGYEYYACEWCGRTATVDVHHIENRGIGGSKLLDTPENLIGLCRPCHDRAHKDREFNEKLKQRVKEILNEGKAD